MKTPAERVEKITREISGVVAQYDVTSWELTFMDDVAKRRTLTPKQETTLRDIEVKVFGEEYDPDTGDLFS